MTSPSNENVLMNPGEQRKTFLHAAMFVAGFSLVFIVGWGGAATLIGQVFSQFKNTLAQIGGVVVILFGLATMGVLKLPWFNYDTRPQLTEKSPQGIWASGLMGLFFAAGWTPCVGATLGAILTLGMTGDSAGQAMVLASGYAFGLGLPFLALGAVVERASRFVGKLRPYIRKIQLASGIFLILIGLMVLTNRLTLIAIWAQRNGFFLDLPLGGAGVPSYFVAVLAGLLSFLSPCVLPLVPAYLGYLSGRAVAS